MRVYRVETKEGKGPYWHGTCPIIAHHSYSEHTPPPQLDFLLCRVDLSVRDRFGFHSIEAARAWFNTKEVRAALLESKLRLYEYEVDADFVIEGHRQLIFTAEKAKRLWCVVW